jgi:bifunctional non-homologous end joining protein LigD
VTPDYAGKRSFDQTPEPEPEVAGDVDPTAARPGNTFVIHQHHARSLHFDLRLEMLNGSTPVLVSWAVPKNLPVRPKQRVLAIHVEDHPFEYGSFSGTIPAGNYGAGEVRIFDTGNYEMLEQKPAKLTFRLKGRRLKGVWHMIQTSRGEKDQWLAMLGTWEGPEPEPPPVPVPMLASAPEAPFDDPKWAFEPRWSGTRAFAVCERETRILVDGQDASSEHPGLERIHERLVVLSAMVDGVIVQTGAKSQFMAFDLVYLDGRSLADEPWQARREALEEAVVPAGHLQLSPAVVEQGRAVYETSVNAGLEGAVAKKLRSTYQPGPSEDWLEIRSRPPE